MSERESDSGNAIWDCLEDLGQKRTFSGYEAVAYQATETGRGNVDVTFRQRCSGDFPHLEIVPDQMRSFRIKQSKFTAHRETFHYDEELKQLTVEGSGFEMLCFRFS